MTLSLPDFGTSFVFGWCELRCLLAARRSDGGGGQRLFTSNTLDPELLAAVREYVGRAEKVRSDSSGGEGSDGAVTVFLYLLLAMSDGSAPSRRTRLRRHFKYEYWEEVGLKYAPFARGRLSVLTYLHARNSTTATHNSRSHS